MKQVERAGIYIRKGGLPYDIASKIDISWQEKHGNPRGFSMGRLTRDLYRRETVFSAWQDDRAVAFITVMPGARKTTLDLVRQHDGCSNGTIHALVVAAIEDAAQQQVETFSLASAPFYLDNSAQSLWARFCDSVYKRRAPLRGLHQFKDCFGPRWVTEYACVDSSFSGLLAMLDLYRLIHTLTSNRESQEIHNDYAFYEFASSSSIWHARLTPEFTASTDPTAEMPCPPLQMP